MKLGDTNVGMIFPGKNGMEVFGVSEKRSDEIGRFLAGILEEASIGDGVLKHDVIRRTVEFAETAVEAVLIFGFFESEFAKLNNPLNGLLEVLVSNEPNRSNKKRPRGKS